MTSTEEYSGSIKKIGRPEVYTQEIADEICEYLAMGYSLRRIDREFDHLPSIRTVFRWMREKEHFCQQYEKAKQESADAMTEDMLFIADDTEGDLIEREGPEGQVSKTPNTANVQRARLQVDTRKWIASKMKPKKYGDKLDLTSGGEKFSNAATVLFGDDTPDESNEKEQEESGA